MKAPPHVSDERRRASVVWAKRAANCSSKPLSASANACCEASGSHSYHAPGTLSTAAQRLHLAYLYCFDSTCRKARCDCSLMGPCVRTIARFNSGTARVLQEWWHHRCSSGRAPLDTSFGGPGLEQNGRHSGSLRTVPHVWQQLTVPWHLCSARNTSACMRRDVDTGWASTGTHPRPASLSSRDFGRRGLLGRA